MADDYKKDLEIDKFSLDIEFAHQPLKFTKWAEKWADAILQRDNAKQQRDITVAKKAKEIREYPDAFGIEKLTEGAIQNNLPLQKEVQEAEQKVIDTQYNVNVLSIVKEAFDQRKSMLEWEGRLFLANYFAEPKVDVEEKEKIDKLTDERMNQVLKQNPRLAKIRNDRKTK
jgi:hypothetical protein